MYLCPVAAILSLVYKSVLAAADDDKEEGRAGQRRRFSSSFADSSWKDAWKQSALVNKQQHDADPGHHQQGQWFDRSPVAGDRIRRRRERVRSQRHRRRCAPAPDRRRCGPASAESAPASAETLGQRLRELGAENRLRGPRGSRGVRMRRRVSKRFVRRDARFRDYVCIATL